MDKRHPLAWSNYGTLSSTYEQVSKKCGGSLTPVDNKPHPSGSWTADAPMSNAGSILPYPNPTNPQTPKHQKWTPARAAVLAATICLVLGVALSACAKDQSSQTTTSVPMVKITIQLIDVVCNTKAGALLFHDHFYMMTTFAGSVQNAKARANTQSQLFDPLDITSGQDLPVPHSPLTVFSAVVPQHGIVKGGFTAYNDTMGLDWGNIVSWIADIAQTVGDGLIDKGIESGNLEAVGAGVIIDLAVKAWYATADIDSGNANQLGQQDKDVSADGPASETDVLHFTNSGGLFGIGSWDYAVKYQITRTSVTTGTIAANMQA